MLDHLKLSGSNFGTPQQLRVDESCWWPSLLHCHGKLYTAANSRKQQGITASRREEQ